MINVVLAVIEHDEKILLIKRERGDFVGLYALPGGKVEESEHIDKAVEREIKEELGLDLPMKRLLGTATEIMHDKNETSFLYCCELEMEAKQKIENPEFQYKWFSKEELKNSKEIIESDKRMVEDFYLKDNINYMKLDCYRDSTGKYNWK